MKDAKEVRLFTEALSLSAEERNEYLNRACGGDMELRRRVEELLQASDPARDFLGELPTGLPLSAGLASSAGEKEGDRIGRYKLLRKIGEGGGGVVFLAEQEEPVRRQVALKVIRPGMDTNDVIARFEAERQALALMDHPSIAHVFDAGATESGRPYFVMELVRGLKITEHCEKNALGTAERLKLFVQVCVAVQHAHQKGIIHRDLKPSNILVTMSDDAKALPKVIDFGIAKATTGQQLTDKTVFTAFEMLVGTPAYMSPEQAMQSSMDVDTRTDVYSLGVVLYELLTGATPFDAKELLKKGLDEVRRVIKEQEPERPSTRLSGMTEGELMALAQHFRAEPPELIRAVRGDLDWVVMRALEKDRSRRYATAHEFGLDVQRFLDGEAISARPPSALYKFRKALLRNKLLVSGIVVIAALLVGSLVVLSMFFARERRARRDADRAKEKAQEITGFLEDMLQGVGPSYARGRDNTMLREILDRTAARVSVEMTNQPEVEIELRALIARLYLEIGEYARAADIQQATLEIDRKLYGAKSAEAAQALNDLGLTYRRDVKLAPAAAAFEEALAIRRQRFGDDNTNVAESLNDLGEMYTQEGRNDEAETLIRKGLAIREKWFGTNSAETAFSLRSLAIIEGDKWKWSEAEALARQVLEIRRAKVGAEDPLVATSLGDVAWTVGAQDRLEEAERLEREALALRQKLFHGPHQDVAKSLYMVGDRLRQEKKFDEALSYLNQALDMQLELHGLDHANTLDTQHSLGLLFEAEGRLADAEKVDREAVAGWRESGETNIPQALAAFDSLRAVLEAERKFDDAEQLLDQELTPEFLKERSSANVLGYRVDLRGRQGRWPEAAADAALACEYQPDDHFRYLILAPLLVVTHDRPGYEQICHEILARFTNTTSPYIADRMAKVCLLLPNSGVDLRLVDTLADRAVTTGKGEGGMPYFQMCKGLSDYRQGRFAEAADWAEKSTNSTTVHAAAAACAVLAMADWRLGRVEEARAALAKGDGLAPTPFSQTLGSAWIDWLFARIFLDEAAATLGADAITPGQAGKTAVQ